MNRGQKTLSIQYLNGLNFLNTFNWPKKKFFFETVYYLNILLLLTRKTSSEMLFSKIL